ncbi:MAG: putative transposase [Sulfobacillus sp.]
MTLRQIMRLTDDGKQIAILTSAGAPAAECAWRLAARWRQENYFKYAREHFALDALDSYADLPDDPERLVVNPAKTRSQRHLDAARADLHTAQALLSEAIGEAAVRAGHEGGVAELPTAVTGLIHRAESDLADARARNRGTETHLPLGQVRPGARLLDTERGLLTHTVRIGAYNGETTLARALGSHYSRAEHEARALIREAFNLSGDIDVQDGRMHIRLDPASAPRRTRAIAALCEQLTESAVTYPGTNLTIEYSVKPHPKHS